MIQSYSFPLTKPQSNENKTNYSGYSFNNGYKHYHLTEHFDTTFLGCWLVQGFRIWFFILFRWRFSCSIFKQKQAIVSEHIDPLKFSLQNERWFPIIADKDSFISKLVLFCVIKKGTNLVSTFALSYFKLQALPFLCIFCFLFSILLLQAFTLMLTVACTLYPYNDRVMKDTI